MENIISKENKLQNILDFDLCKRLVTEAKEKGETYIILCPHYSINVQMKYEDGEQLGYDLDELGEYLNEFPQVNDYDDLIIDLSENED